MRRRLMKFYLLSDLQLMMDNPICRLDDFPATQMGKIRFIIDRAIREKAIIIQAGDFFDTPRNWHVAYAYMKLLRDYNWATGNPVYVIYGQHDLYMHSKATRNATALGVLSAAGVVKVLGRKSVWIHGLHLYGANFGSSVTKLLSNKDRNILVIHKQIGMMKLFPGQKNFFFAPKFLADHPDYQIILCGDVHRRFFYEHKGRVILNSGCLSRYTADEYNFNHKPGFYVWDDQTNEYDYVVIPHKPAEEVITRDHLDSKQKLEGILDDFIKSIKKGRGESAGSNFLAELADFVYKNNIPSKIIDILSEIIDEEVKWK
jgi:DNA repair protein SbcD/Mre11